MNSVTSTLPIDIRRMLHEHLRYEDKEREPWKLHASALTKSSPEFCPREAVLRKKMATPLKSENIPTALAVTFEWGRLVEARVSNWFAEMGRSVGDWKCNHKPCGHTYIWQTKPKVCQRCQGEEFKYVERRAWSEITGISNSTDLFLNIDRPKLRLLEIKSIDKDEFKALAGPLAEHRVRTSLYLRNLSECNDKALQTRVDHNVGSVLYVSKGGYGVATPGMESWPFYDGKFSPFKVYDVARDDALTQPYWEKGKATTDALRGGPTPPRICSIITTKRAQTCPVAGACFNLQE